MDGAPGEITKYIPVFRPTGHPLGVPIRSRRIGRTPDRSVRRRAGKAVSVYKSTTCGLDQPRNLVISSVNEPY